MTTLTAEIFGAAAAGQSKRASTRGKRGTPAAQDTEQAERESQATKLVRLAISAGAEAFHAPDREAFLSVPTNGHNETMPLRSRAASSWLRELFYAQLGKSPNGSAIADAIGTLEGRAVFSGAERKVWLRVAEHGGHLYVDPGWPDWRAIEITPHGWRIVASAPVRFRRPPGMAPLPVPAPNGSLAPLRQYLNVADDAGFVLAIAPMINGYRPRGPHPVTVLEGEQGSAKSTAGRVLRNLLDPHVAPLRSEPREPRDLAVATRNGFVLAFDNVSGLQVWLSDGLCRIATGGAFGVRALYTDADEILLDACRPTILTSIDSAAVRGDLLDRAIVLTLPAIDDAHRLTESEFWKAFEADWPRIFGAVLDCVAAGLRYEAEVQLDRLPRMADFARFLTAAERAGHWPAGLFLDAYAGNRQSAIEVLLDGDPLAQAVRHLGNYEGTAAELLDRLSRGLEVKPPKYWPASPRALSNALRRLAPSLRKVRCDVRFLRTPSARLIVIEAASASSASSETLDFGQKDAHDAADDAAGDFYSSAGEVPSV